MRELKLARETVRRFVRAATVTELLAVPQAGRRSILDEFKPYLHERWNAGVNGSELFREIRTRGYTGSLPTVLAYVRPFRLLAKASPVATVPKVRQIVGWLLRRPDDLTDDDKHALSDLKTRCPHLAALAGHVTAFAEILTGRHGERLDHWIARVDADDLPHLRSFTTGLRQDHAAVVNGLTLPYSSGAVEGTVNKIKMLKDKCLAAPNSTC